MPLTSDEQKAALGQVYRKPQQGDLLTGEYAVKPPKTGRGSHVRLHREVSEPPKAVGMAFFPGTGPDGKYCRDCEHCGDQLVKRAGRMVEFREACAKAREMTGTVETGGIGTNRACKYFEPREA